MSLEIKEKIISPKQVLSITHHVRVGGLSQKIEESLAILHDIAREQNAEISGPPFGIYHGAVNEKDDGPVEICLPVRGDVNERENVTLKQLHGGSAACVTMVGDQCEYPLILKGYDAVAEWIQAKGYYKFGPPREIWHSSPGEDAKMEIVWLYRYGKS
jgi:effector-binding domain-containing protein